MQISFADYALFVLLVNHSTLAPGFLDTFPLLKSFYERMTSRPGISKYHQSEAYLRRPITNSGNA